MVQPFIVCQVRKSLECESKVKFSVKLYTAKILRVKWRQMTASLISPLSNSCGSKSEQVLEATETCRGDRGLGAWC